MGWSTTAPSGVTWTNSKSFSSQQFNWYQVSCTADAARGSGNTYYIRLNVRYSSGTQGQNVPQLYLYPDWTASNSSVGWWYYTGSGTGNVTVGLSEFNGYFNSGAASASITIPAKWTYAVNYYGNGATGGATAAGTKTSGETYYISANGFTKTGYSFVGWNTNPNATTAQYSPGAAYTTDASLNLYAIWQANTYLVSYNGNDATGGSTSSQTKTYGIDLTLQQNGFTKTGYNFLHWNTATDDSGTEYAAGATYTANAALTLYAIWKRTSIPVYFNDNDTIREIERAFFNDNGTIREVSIYINVNGSIKHIV